MSATFWDFIRSLPTTFWPTVEECKPKDPKYCTDEELIAFITKYNVHDWGQEQVHNHLCEELNIKRLTYSDCLERGTLNYKTNYKIRSRMVEIYQMLIERENGR